MKKYEIALLLREYGFKYSEIIRELYPDEWRLYKSTGDRRLYDRLRKRVWRLLRFANDNGGHLRIENVDSLDMWTPVDLADNGGERDPLRHRSIELTLSPRTRKAGKKGAERQIIEYEQYLYYIYKKHLEDYDKDGLLWSTIKTIHGVVFHAYYNKYHKNMWSGKRASKHVKAYAYSIITASALILGNLSIRYILYEILEPDKKLVREIGALVFSHILA